MRAALDKCNDIGATIAGQRLNNLRFADDIGLITEILEQAQKLLDHVDKESVRYGQEISATKTEWMRIGVRSDNHNDNEQLLLRGSPLNKVNNFKYLGSNIASSGDCMQDIRVRTAIALRTMSDLSKTWNNRNVSIQTKMRLYRALILPIALYGCETWTLKQAEEKKLLVFEMASMRKILGVKLLDKVRNEDIRKKLGCMKTLVQIVYERQHRWLGHVLRMDNRRIARTVLQGKVEGKRKQGRQRTTWYSSVNERTHMSLQQATDMAQDRLRWKEFETIVGAHVRNDKA